MHAARGAMDKAVRAAGRRAPRRNRAKWLVHFVFANVYIEVTGAEAGLLSDRWHVPFA